MKFIIPFCTVVLLSFVNKPTVETYDWSVYESSFKTAIETVSTVLNAQLIINDHLDFQIDQLPQKTKSQLAIINDAAYAEWKKAEVALGKEEAAKYWEIKKSKAQDIGGPACSRQMEKEINDYTPIMYASIKNCQSGSLTDCHLAFIQEQMNIVKRFDTCLIEKYGERASPLKPIFLPSSN